MDFSSYHKKFRERLTEHMQEKSILAFSKIIGIPERTLYSWVNGEKFPGFENLILLSMKFNCTTDYLLGIED